MQQVIVDFGQVSIFGLSVSLRIFGYGLMLVFGFILGIWLAWWRARRMGENHQVVASVGLLALVGGVLGARLAFVIERWDERFAPAALQGRDPLAEILNITSGGLIYYGGVLVATAPNTKSLPVIRWTNFSRQRSTMVSKLFWARSRLVRTGCFSRYVVW